MAAKLIQVIEVTVHRGDGTKDNPYFIATEYWSTDGQFLADNADCVTKVMPRGDEPFKSAVAIPANPN